MLRKIFKTYGRHRPAELISALLTIPIAELVEGLVNLFTAGEIRFATKKRVRTGGELCSMFYGHLDANAPLADHLLKAAQSKQKEQHRTHYSIAALVEQVRCSDVNVGVIRSVGDFAIPNELRALYARLVVMRDPTLCGLFMIKPSVVDELLVVDGRLWSDFAQEYHEKLWPMRKATSLRKPPARVSAVLTSKRRQA